MGCMCSDIPVALFLGGFDPSGGAGILRDAAVAAALGVHPMAIPLADTVQNGLGCASVSPPGTDPAAYLDALMPHLKGGWGVKLSMFNDAQALGRLLPRIRELKPLCAIWDPIVGPTRGACLHGRDTLMGVLAQLAAHGDWVVSPNIPEARLLAGLPDGHLEAAAEKLTRLGALSVWIRGGHGSDESVRDLWCDGDGPRWMTAHERLAGDPRGTGCTATSAWLAFRLNGLGPAPSAEAAVSFIRDAWRGLHRPGGVGRHTFPPPGLFG